MSNLLTKEQIIATIPNLKRETVEIEEWGGSVLVRELAGAERDDIELRFYKGQKTGDFRGVRVKVILLACIKEDGSPLFDEKKDSSILDNLSAKALDKLFLKIASLSGLNPDNEQEGNAYGKNLPEKTGLE